MRIRRYPDLQIPVDHVNAAFLDDATPTRTKKSKKPGRATRRYANAKRDAQIALDDAKAGRTDFSGTPPGAVVGLFVLLHAAVYGVEPEELIEGVAFGAAMSAVRRLIEIEFGGRIEYALDFVRWTWARERRQFPGRTSDWRIGWRWQFCSKSLLTDYRIVMAKTTPAQLY
jgi:hypothetical protein